MDRIIVAMAVSLFCSFASGQMTDDQQRLALIGLREKLTIGDTIRRIEVGEVSKRQIEIIYLILTNVNEVEIHRMRGATENSVFLSDDGHKEAVYDEQGKLVGDGVNDGSYNYFDPKDEPLPHFTFDILPWMLWGQSSEDPTSKSERIHAYCADFRIGLREAREHKEPGAAKNFTLTANGSNEGIATFVKAIEQGKASEIFELFDREKPVSDDEIAAIMKKLEVALDQYLGQADADGD